MMYVEQRATYIAYLQMKVAEADWHAVSDAANDLRELEAEWKTFNKANSNVQTASAPSIHVHQPPIEGAGQAIKDFCPISQACDRGPTLAEPAACPCARCGRYNCRCPPPDAR